MSDPTAQEALDVLGPVDAVVLQLPANGISKGWKALLEAVRDGLFTVLDADFVEKTAEGLRFLDATEITSLGAGDFISAKSELLDEADLQLVTEPLAIGQKAVVLLKENRTFTPIIAAFASEGATLLSDEPVLPEDLESTLAELESTS
ncbi:hypothetical protein [Propionibacterium sp.]|uniref:hypothetical protein n=1 Tax=Propionibacterium sp. TaxID=1977903 RepID=UPI0039EA3CF8